MTRTTTRRRARRTLQTCLLAAAAALATASSAFGEGDAVDARASYAAMLAGAPAGPAATAQQADRPMPKPARLRGLDAVTASGLFHDAAFDSSLAPDLRQMMPFTSDDGRYTVVMTLGTNALIFGDYVSTFVNTDGNAATGEPVFGGADVAVTIVGLTGTDAVLAQRWNGVAFADASFPSLVSFPSGTTDEVWSISAAELGIAPGTPTSLVFATMYEGLYDDYFDFAPEPGLAPFAFSAGALAPPPAPPAPAPPVASPLPAPVTTGATIAARPAAPLVVRGFRVRSNPKAIRVTLAWTRGSGRVTWRVRLRARVDGRRVTKVVRGAGRAGTRTVTRTVRVPAAWAGARVSARLEVRDAGRTLTRSRSLRMPARTR
jgi:hypothetical protein